MSGANTRSVLARFGDNNWEKGEDFVHCRLNVIGHSPWGFSGPILQIFILGEIGRQLTLLKLFTSKKLVWEMEGGLSARALDDD